MAYWTKVLVTKPDALHWISGAHTAEGAYPHKLSSNLHTHKRNVKRNVNGLLILQHILNTEGMDAVGSLGPLLACPLPSHLLAPFQRIRHKRTSVIVPTSVS